MIGRTPSCAAHVLRGEPLAMAREVEDGDRGLANLDHRPWVSPTPCQPGLCGTGTIPRFAANNAIIKKLEDA